MRILTISNASWDDRNSVGNTQSNWFSDWPDTEFCSLYTRETMPDNLCCHFYFQVTAVDVVKHFLSRKNIGRGFQRKEAIVEDSYSTTEGKMVTSLKGWKRNALRAFVEFVYSTKIWLNSKLKNYISEFNPDIVFCFAIAEPFRYNIIKYIKTYTKAKVVMWVADDVWGQTQNMNWLLRTVYKARYRHLFRYADRVYGVSQMLCDEYSQLFNTPIKPLYKGCDLTPSKTSVGHPIRMVYAGNLFYGRDKTLIALVNAIKDINKDNRKVALSIYSATKVPDEVYRLLDVEGSSTMCGVRPYEEIKKIMSEADIVLHVESFDEKQIKDVRLSFSTKIIDCMQSGAAMMVIGPKGIASVEYPRRIEGAIVVDDLSDLKQVVNSIIENPSQILDGAGKISDFARKNHEISAVHNKLQTEFQNVIAS